MNYHFMASTMGCRGATKLNPRPRGSRKQDDISIYFIPTAVYMVKLKGARKSPGTAQSTFHQLVLEALPRFVHTTLRGTTGKMLKASTFRIAQKLDFSRTPVTMAASWQDTTRIEKSVRLSSVSTS